MTITDWALGLLTFWAFVELLSVDPVPRCAGPVEALRVARVQRRANVFAFVLLVCTWVLLIRGCVAIFCSCGSS